MIRVPHTSEMEKALQLSHGIGYADYERNLDMRIKVEKERQKDYEKSLSIVAEYTR